MCDRRDLLIGYLYDECSDAERRAMEAHLDGCPDCRADLGGLRDVRQDLLAWDVPTHESVWRPFVAPRAVNPWRAVPAWAMTAAATLVFAAGAAGGAATRLLWPVAAPAVAMTASAASPVSVTPAAETMSQRDLDDLKTAILTQVRAEMDQRLLTLASHDTVRVASTGVPPRNAIRDLSQRLAAFEALQRQQVDFNIKLDNKMSAINSRYAVLNSLVATNRQALQPTNFIEAR